MNEQKNLENETIQEEEPKKKSFFQKYLSSLNSVPLPKNFWKISEIDYDIWRLQLFLTATIWILSESLGTFISFLCFWDGPNYVYAAKTWYNMPSNKSNPWFRYFKYNASYFACHLPGYPLVIRIFSILSFNNYFIGDILSIIFCSLLFPYVFRRFLIIYSLVSDPEWTTKLSIVIPLRFVIYKIVGASEPLYISYCLLALIFFKTDQLVYMLLAMWGATITRVEGLSIVGTIGLSYLLKFDILRAMFTSLGFLGSLSVLYFHKIKYSDYLAYFKFNQGQQGLIRFPPFHLIIHSPQWTYLFPLSFNLLYIETTILAGITVFLTCCIPMAIFCVVYAIYISLLFHPDIYRYSLPAYIPCVLIAFDPILSHKVIKQNGFYLVPFLIFVILVYSLGMLGTNITDDQFFLEVCFA